MRRGPLGHQLRRVAFQKSGPRQVAVALVCRVGRQLVEPEVLILQRVGVLVREGDLLRWTHAARLGQYVQPLRRRVVEAHDLAGLEREFHLLQRRPGRQQPEVDEKAALVREGLVIDLLGEGLRQPVGDALRVEQHRRDRGCVREPAERLDLAFDCGVCRPVG